MNEAQTTPRVVRARADMAAPPFLEGRRRMQMGHWPPRLDVPRFDIGTESVTPSWPRNARFGQMDSCPLSADLHGLGRAAPAARLSQKHRPHPAEARARPVGRARRFVYSAASATACVCTLRVQQVIPTTRTWRPR